MPMKQATLDGDSIDIPDVECRLYGGLCGNRAVYVAELVGNEYVDGAEVEVCESCLDGLEDGVEEYQTLTESEVFERAERQ